MHGAPTPPDDEVLALNYCAKFFEFADVTLVSSVKPTVPYYYNWHPIAPMNYAEAMRWEVAELFHFCKTDHQMFVSNDGWIRNPHLWTDNWLNYDMIGAPWPASWGFKHRVGNTGFCIRSRDFLRLSACAVSLHGDQVGDVFTCRTMHQPFVELGIRYAPVDIAARFSWEHFIEEGISGPAVSFGFHGWVEGKTREKFLPMIQQ